MGINIRDADFEEMGFFVETYCYTSLRVYLN